LDPVQFEHCLLLLDEMKRLQQKTSTAAEPWTQNLICSNLFLLLDMTNRLLPLTLPETEFPNKTKKTVDAVVRYVNENFAEKITLEQLEKQFYLTRFHLCHIFKEETGFTLSNYIQHLRVVEAQRLLRLPKSDIATVCYQCGFPSIQQFYKVFKKITHQTPRQYKQAQLTPLPSPAGDARP
jgi:YesN/AraC family two-component response regulator